MRTRNLALTEGITAGVLFGTAAVFIRFLDQLDALHIAFWRVLIACLTLGLISILVGRSFHFAVIRKNLRKLFILSFFLSLHFIFFVSAVKDTTLLNATLLVNTAPIFSMFISTFLFNVKPSRLAMVGLTLSLIGVGVIIHAETTMVEVGISPSVSSPTLKGDLQAVLAALVEALYLNYGRKMRRQMNILPIMLPIYFMSAAILAVLSTSTAHQLLTLPAQTELILALIGLGVLPTATAHTLYFSSLSNLKSFQTATMALLEPVGATVLGIILFHEIPHPLFVLGATLVLTGIFFMVKEEN